MERVVGESGGREGEAHVQGVISNHAHSMVTAQTAHALSLPVASYNTSHSSETNTPAMQHTHSLSAASYHSSHSSETITSSMQHSLFQDTYSFCLLQFVLE